MAASRPTRSASSWPSTRCRICATARNPTRPPLSTASPSPGRRHRRLHPAGARNCPTTTSPTRRRLGMRQDAFDGVACVIVKHANPCGGGRRRQPAGSRQEGLLHRSHLRLRRHHRLQHHVDKGRRRSRQRPVLEVLIAPPTPDEALAPKAKQNVRVLVVARHRPPAFDYKRVGGGLLVQSADFAPDHPQNPRSQGRHQARPHRTEIGDLLFAWRVAKQRQVQRHRSLQGRHDHRRRRRPDEPRGFRPHRQNQGRERRPVISGAWWRRMPSSRSVTASTCWPRPAPPPSSSRVAHA